jgi:hypothetical protein
MTRKGEIRGSRVQVGRIVAFPCVGSERMA